MEIYRGQVKRTTLPDHDCTIRARKQRTDINKYCFVNRTIKLWNKLHAEALATVRCKSHIFINRGRKGIISERKWRVFEGWWRNVQTCMEVKNGEWCVVKRSEVMWKEVKGSEVMISDEICVLWLIYSYVAVCWFCAVRCLIIICFSLLFYNYSINVLCLVLYVFSILCILCFCIVLYIAYTCLFPVFLQISTSLSGHPTAGNKHHIKPVPYGQSKNIRHQRTKFSCPANLAPRICAPL